MTGLPLIRRGIFLIMRPCDAAVMLTSWLTASLVGPRAMIRCKSRQARKGATVATDSCAVVWLAGGATRPDTARWPGIGSTLIGSR